MMEDSVKDYLFRYIDEKKQIIQKLLADQNYSKIVKMVLEDCYDTIISKGSKEKVLATLATGLLHYLLTNALITSQRKVKYQGLEIDLVIPDLMTLKKDPEKTLIILIPRTSEKTRIDKMVKNLEKIQSKKQNIWLVMSETVPLENKTFVIAKKDETFSKIIYDISQFVNVSGSSKFKILRV